MNTWKVIFATLVIFVAGVVTGGLLVGYSDRAQLRHHRLWQREGITRLPDNRLPGPREAARLPNLPGKLPQGLRMDLLRDLDRELQLSPEQHGRVEKIITEGQERNKQLWERIQPQMRREMQETREQIRAVLTPEQVKRFEELMKQRPQRKGDEPVPPDRRSRDARRPLPPRAAPSPNE